MIGSQTKPDGSSARPELDADADLASTGPDDPRLVHFDWEAMEDAFGRTFVSVEQYLHLRTGAISRLEHGVTDPAFFELVRSDPEQRFIDPVPPACQYRWLEEFIDTVDDEEMAAMLSERIQGKKVFRRFKDVLALDRDLLGGWYAFRVGRVHEQIHAWLALHGLAAATPPPAFPWTLGSLAEARWSPRQARRHLLALTGSLGVGELIALTDLAMFLRSRSLR